MNVENLHIGLTSLVLVVLFFMGIIGWFVRRDVATMTADVKSIGVALNDHIVKDEGMFAKHDVRIDHLEREDGYRRAGEMTPPHGSPAFGRKGG